MSVASAESFPDPDTLHPNQLARRNNIVKAALDLLTKNDYDDVKITAVATKSGVALGTVYRYFNSKERLFAEAYILWQQRRYEALKERKIRFTSEENYVRKMFTGSFRELWKNPNVTKVLYIINSANDPALSEMRKQIEKQMLQILTPAFGNNPSKTDIDIFRTLNNVLYGNFQSVSMNSISYEEGLRRMNAAVDLIYKDKVGKSSQKRK